MATPKITLSLLAGILALLGLGAGCKSPPTKPAAASTPSQLTRNNCYSLLHQLLDEQKDVSFLRFIKSENTALKNLTKGISAASGAGSKLLEEFAQQDLSIVLDDFDLPSGENKTREAIEATKKGEILSQKGDEFELTLLLAQTEALSYAWHLAEVCAQNESDPHRAHALLNLSQEMKHYYEEAFSMLLSKRTDNANADDPKVAVGHVKGVAVEK